MNDLYRDMPDYSNYGRTHRDTPTLTDAAVAQLRKLQEQFRLRESARVKNLQGVRFNMARWLDKWKESESRDQPMCGTTGCIAGWACLGLIDGIEFKRFNERMVYVIQEPNGTCRRVSPESDAARVIGLQNDQALDLFLTLRLRQDPTVLIDGSTVVTRIDEFIAEWTGEFVPYDERYRAFHREAENWARNGSVSYCD